MYTIGQMIVVKDEDTHKIFWRGGFIEDKGESDWSPDEPLELSAESFPVGTIVEIKIPEHE